MVTMTTAGNPLAQLIDTVKEANGWSDPMIVARARHAGHQISKSLVSTIRREGMATLVPGTIRALADGLGVPVVRVLRAALESAGLPVGDESVAPETAVRNDLTLSDETKRVLLAMLREARIAGITTELQGVNPIPDRVKRGRQTGDQG